MESFQRDRLLTDALSGIVINGIPVEELLFGFSFGAYWAEIDEHLTWRRSSKLVGQFGASRT